MSREDEALDMVLESAAKIAAWWQDNHQPGPKDVVGLYDLARDTYASYATYLYTKDNA